MSDTKQFLDEMLPRIHEAETALHNGDAGPRFGRFAVLSDRSSSRRGFSRPIRPPASYRRTAGRSSTTTFQRAPTCCSATGQTTTPACGTTSWACGNWSTCVRPNRIAAATQRPAPRP
jgi:hypothetical protein